MIKVKDVHKMYQNLILLKDMRLVGVQNFLKTI